MAALATAILETAWRLPELPGWAEEVRALLVPLLLALAVLVVRRLLGPVIRRLDDLSHPLGAPLRALANLVLPAAAAWFWVRHELLLGSEELGARIITTLFWVSVLHGGLSLVNALLFGRPPAPGHGHERLPKLFRDLLRGFLVVLGGAVVASEVWQTDLTGWITALGVGSLVLGLALQDTLGNLFSGVALLFEQPVSQGDWL